MTRGVDLVIATLEKPDLNASLIARLASLGNIAKICALACTGTPATR